MEQKKKKIDFKIVVIVVVVIIAIVEGIVIFTSNNKDSSSKLTQEEQYAVDFLLKSLLQPYRTEIHKVWIYKEDNKYYFAYYLNVQNNGIWSGTEEFLFGNEEGLTLEELETFEMKSMQYSNYNTPAKEKGHQLNAEKIQQAFREQY